MDTKEQQTPNVHPTNRSQRNTHVLQEANTMNMREKRRDLLIENISNRLRDSGRYELIFTRQDWGTTSDGLYKLGTHDIIAVTNTEHLHIYSVSPYFSIGEWDRGVGHIQRAMRYYANQGIESEIIKGVYVCPEFTRRVQREREPWERWLGN